MKYIIITGASRGIGEAIAKKFLLPGNVLICISRNENQELIETASNLEIPIHTVIADLSDTESIQGLSERIFDKIDTGKASAMALINNAGTVQPVAAVGSMGVREMESHIHLNLLAPAALSNLFIRETLQLSIPKVILNISSGAAIYPTAGWSMYCTGKAGIDMLTRVTGLEQSAAINPVKAFSLAPGIVETAMQAELRNAEVSDFPGKEHFVSLFNEGKLTAPAEVAEVILHSLFNPAIPQGGNLTLEQLKEFRDLH